ncbi:hypothetical protein M8C21_002287, partial [Ambrosia artemisiifolia]
ALSKGNCGYDLHTRRHSVNVEGFTTDIVVNRMLSGVVDNVSKALHERDYHMRGFETMYNGLTGRRLQPMTVFGPSGRTAPVLILTKPAEGRGHKNKADMVKVICRCPFLAILSFLVEVARSTFLLMSPSGFYVLHKCPSSVFV